MVKDEVREEDQVKGCPRACVCVCVCACVGIGCSSSSSSIWPQREEERLDGMPPHVAQHTHSAAPRGLDVLRDVKGYIIHQSFVRVIR